MRTQPDRDPQQLELFGHGRGGRRCFRHARAEFEKWSTWYAGLSRPRVYAVQTAAALIGLMLYGGVLLGIWHRAVASDRKRALAHSTDLAAPAAQPARLVAPQPRVLPPSTPLAEAPAPSPVPAPASTPAPIPSPAVAAPAVAPVVPPHRAKRDSPARAPRRPLPRAMPVQAPRPRLPETRVARSVPPVVVSPPSVTVPPIPTVASAPPVVAEVPPSAPPVSPEMVATREPASREPDPLAADHSAVNAVLAAYRRSYNNLDATSAAAIWRGVDVQALRRAFGSLSRQNLRFDRCDVRVIAADRAVARCDGLLSYVPKVGDATPQERRLAYTINLQRAAERWLIAEVTAKGM